ncbi:MAG TPA: VOC family protein [Opitutaceae bacterium]
MTPDHIELFVPDRAEAVAWYREWLGFAPMPEHAAWAAAGPIMLTCDGGRTMLALFTGEPQGSDPTRGWRRLALRAEAAEFLRFRERFRASGQSLDGPVDHDKAWSFYFSDPWGNLLEVTTYEYLPVKSRLAAGS